jgi:AraC-like DNA-binding protein
VTTSRIEDLAAAIARHATGGYVPETGVRGLAIGSATAPTEWGPVMYKPALFVIAQGRKLVRLGDVTYAYDPAHYLLSSIDVPVLCRVARASPEKPYLGVKLSLDPVVVGELLTRTAGASSGGAPARGLVVSPLEPELLDAVSRLVALLDRPADEPVLAPLLHREITYRVLTGPQGARLRQIASSGAPAERVARAISWIKDHAAEPLRMGALARKTGMGLSAFHLHFKTVTGMSPLQFQKRLRLQEAQRLMVAAGLTASEAAHRVGYESPSQFSREYRRAFGAPPRQDVVTIRTDLQGEQV